MGKKSKSLLLPAILLFAAFGGCSDSSFFPANGGFATPGFTLTDAGGAPLGNVFWSVTGSGFSATRVVTPGISLGFTDDEGDTCNDPQVTTPSTDEGTAEQDGCTDSNGQVFISCSPGNIFTLFVDDGSISESITVFCSGFSGGNTELSFEDLSGEALPIVMYHSVATHDGNLGGRSGADAICAADKPSGLAQTETSAFLSVSGSDEIRDMGTNYGVPSDRAIVTPNDTLIANDWADLLDGTIQNTLQSGGLTTEMIHFTGSNSDGSLNSFNCLGWTTNDGAEGAHLGRYDFTDSNWIDFTEFGCNAASALLCIAFSP